jgi:hypothetical protein
MAKELQPKILELRIGGETFKRGVKNFSPPDPQKPWWMILLENGNLICATGDVSVEFKAGEGINSEDLKGILDLIR